MRAIVLHPGVDQAAFETFMQTEVFPKTRMLLRAVTGTAHALFKSDTGVGGQPHYVWATVNALVGDDSALATPEIPKDLHADLVEKIEAYGTLTTLTEVAKIRKV
jgi:hypothetical protein